MKPSLFEQWQDACRELLRYKFLYYELGVTAIGDQQYDELEKDWIKLGKKIGKTRTPPFWIGFDRNHPFANAVAAAVQMGEK